MATVYSVDAPTYQMIENALERVLGDYLEEYDINFEIEEEEYERPRRWGPGWGPRRRGRRGPGAGPGAGPQRRQPGGRAPPEAPPGKEPPAAGAAGTAGAAGEVQFRSVAGYHFFDVEEFDKVYVLTTDAPDFMYDEITVELTDNVLTVRGEKSLPRSIPAEHGEKKRTWRSERHSLRMFERSFELPAEAVPDGITAVLERGLLKVIVPKQPHAAKPQARRVHVTSGSGAKPAAPGGTATSHAHA